MAYKLGLRQWDGDSVGVLFQRYYYLKRKGTYYCFYLRWKYSDPWSFEVVKLEGTEKEIFYWKFSGWISGCLFSQKNIWFSEADNIALIQKTAFRLGMKFLRNRKTPHLSIKDIFPRILK